MIFLKEEELINSYKGFWSWFEIKEETFYKNIKSKKDIEGFFNELSPKLKVLNGDFNFLVGMSPDGTLELVVTPDGVIKSIVFAEDLIRLAPKLSNWTFTALKSGQDIKKIGIRMNGYTYNSDNLSFYPINHKNYPDLIDIVIVYDDYQEKDKSSITNAVWILLDNYLGELNSATTIDNLTVISKEDAEEELIPIFKLKNFLIWREKEFVEKYDGTSRSDTYNDDYSCFEGEFENGNGLVGFFNKLLLTWDNKASHPWVLKIDIGYNGGDNGMPDGETLQLLNYIEDELMLELKDFEGYLNIGRETGNDLREIYFACKEFRKPSKAMYEFTRKYSNKFTVSYDIYKDKYWQSFERFTQV
jgi:hypothetical protein